MSKMRKEVDFLVVGSGVAGLCFALKAANFGKVCVVTKSKIDEGSTRYAQGGIASVVYQPDSYEKHIQDTMVAGDELSDRHIVELTIRESTERVMELVEWGVDFDKNKDGSFALAKEGGHSEFRVLHHKDITGYEVQYSLKKSFASPGTVVIKKAGTVKTVLKKLTTGKTYFVRVRAYKTVKGKKYYSAWSKAKSAKVK